MQIELTPELEEMVRGQVVAGYYTSAAAVVEQALLEWRSRHEEHLPSKERQDRIRKLFEEFDAAGGAEFELARDLRPAEDRELF